MQLKLTGDLSGVNSIISRSTLQTHSVSVFPWQANLVLLYQLYKGMYDYHIALHLTIPHRAIHKLIGENRRARFINLNLAYLMNLYSTVCISEREIKV